MQPALDIRLLPGESPHVFRRLGQASLIFALLCALGAHWSVLQSVAWTTMLAGNLRTASLTVALQRTLDGKHPCALCKQIAAGKNSEKKTEAPPQLQRFEFLTATTPYVFNAPTHYCLLRPDSDPSRSVSSAPPTPPPRTAFV